MRIDLQRLPINKAAIPWIIWSIAGLFYFYEIILRMVPGTMTGELMHIFRINATELGLFTAFYYWAYVLMQIPAGLIVDRFSVRKTLLAATALCISGFVIIHATHDIHIAEIGRFIIGFGSAFAYVSALKVASVWLPKNHFGLASTIVDSLGMIGAMFADVVLVKMNMKLGYMDSFGFLIIVGLVVFITIFLLFKNSPQKTDKHIQALSKPDKSNVIDKLRLITRNPQIWIIGLVGLLFYLPSSVLGDVWGIPYLKTVYGISKEQASDLMATFFAGWTICGPFLGALSDKIERRILPLKLTILMSAILFSLVIFEPAFSRHLLPIGALYVVFFLIGVSIGTHPLTFALAKENYPIRISGTVVAFTNTLIMLGGILFQPLVGLLLDTSHHSLDAHHIVHYTAKNFTFALSIIPILLIVSFILMFFVKETGYKIHEEPVKK